MGQYRSQVDLMGSKDLGGKTFLNLVDGIWGNRNKSSTPPEKWSMTPFNDDYTSCLFASQDPVAIDSVGLDFLRTQWATLWTAKAGVDDYLHEAALANNPPSGTFYDPDHPIGSPEESDSRASAYTSIGTMLPANSIREISERETVSSL